MILEAQYSWLFTYVHVAQVLYINKTLMDKQLKQSLISALQTFFMNNLKLTFSLKTFEAYSY